MPGFDGTGPRGQGSMTGGARGFCAEPTNAARFIPYGAEFCGRGRGRGFRNRYWSTGLPAWARANQPVSGQKSVNDLKAYADQLKQELEAIQGRIENLEKKD
jgi:hypothetical protein